jgi:Ca2+-binding RTX toxin-like protein
MTDFFAGNLFAADNQTFAFGTAAPGQESHFMSRLSNGGFVIAFAYGQAIFARIFDANGHAVGGPVQLVAIGSDPSLAALPNGGFAVAYSANDGSLNGIYFRTFDASGNATAGVTAVNQATFGNQQQAFIQVLENGEIAVSWSDNGTNGVSNVVARVFSDSGLPVTDNLLITSNQFQNSYNSSMVALPQGGFAITWTGPQSGSSTEANVRLVDANYTVQAVTFSSRDAAPGPSWHDAFFSSMTVLASGNIIVTWTDSSPAGEVVKGQLLNPAGTAIGTPFQIGASGINSGQSSVTALDNGGYVVTWRVDTPAAGPNYFQRGDVLAQIYAANGSTVGSSFVVSSIADLGQDLPLVTQFGSGDIAFTFRTFDNFGRENLAVRIFYSVLNGTENADNLLGTTGVDVIRALGGDDWLTGNGGSDSFFGGGGNDRYLDVRADDIITELSNEGTDEVNTALANYALPANVENLTAGGGSTIDRVFTGNDLDNVISGGSGDDQLYGEAGNDTLWGENGDDLLHGGSGNDTINGGNGNDTAFVNGGTTNADTGVQIIDLGMGTADGTSGPMGEYDLDRLVIDYSDITQNVNFHGTTNANGGPTFGATGANAVADIGGAQRLNFSGVGALTVTTGSGDDRVYGVGRTDIISTGAGNDSIYAYPISVASVFYQYSKFDGGSGLDILHGLSWHDLTTAVVLDLNDPDGVTIGSGATERYVRGIESLYGFTSGSGDDIFTLHRSGTLPNDIETGDGNDTVTVYGATTSTTTAYHRLNLGFGIDHLIVDYTAAVERVEYFKMGTNGNGGYTKIGGVQLHTYLGYETAAVSTGSADDVLDGRNAVRSQEFNAGSGNDVLYGGNRVDTLNGGSGNDRLEVKASGSGSHVIGGADQDTLAVTGAVALGSLSGIEAIEFQSNANLTLTAAQFNTGMLSTGTLSGTGTLTINMGPADFELALQKLVIAGGSNLSMTVNGSAAANSIKTNVNTVNTVNAGAGNDQIRGGLLADTINGGDNNDKIIGYGGADILTGGAGADQFRYLFASDSGTGAGADRITDFLSGTDRLNFALLDADPVAAGRQALTYIDTAAFSATGAAQVRYGVSGADLLVQVDLDGDGTSDMEIVLAGAGGQVLTGGDFML